MARNDYTDRYDAERGEVVRERKSNSWWPALLIVPLLLLGGWSLLNRASDESTYNGTGNTSFGVGGAPPADATPTLMPEDTYGWSGPTGVTGATGPSTMFETDTPSPDSSY